MLSSSSMPWLILHACVQVLGTLMLLLSHFIMDKSSACFSLRLLLFMYTGIRALIDRRSGSQLLADVLDPKTCLVTRKKEVISHKPKGSCDISQDPWEAEAGRYICEGNVNCLIRVAYPLTINGGEKFHFCPSKVNSSFIINWSHFI